MNQIKGRTSRYSAREVLLTASTFSFGGFCFAIILGLDRTGWWLVPLLASSFLATYFVWRKFPWNNSLAPYMSFGGALLLACFLNRILYLGDFLVAGERFSEWPYYVSNPEIAVLKAELMSVMGVFITFFAWVYAGGLRVARRVILGASAAINPRLFLVIYISSLILLVVIQVFGRAAGFSAMAGVMMGLGAACSFFLPAQILRGRYVQVTVAGLMCAPFFYVALGTGMKESIILSILPAAYYFWVAVKSRSMRVTAILVAVVSISILTSFIGYFRAEVWQQGREVSRTESVKEYSALVSREGLSNVLSAGAQKFLGRANASVYRGWAVARADEYGYEPELVFAPMAFVFIPRFIWAEKPLIRQGWEYSGLVFGSKYTRWSTSSTAAGYYPALYLGGGWIAVLLGALAVGVMMAMLMRLASLLGGQQLLSLFSYSMIPYALRLDESWTVGALSGPIISFVYVYAIYTVFNLVFSRNRKVYFSLKGGARLSSTKSG